jgi:hypothetical protein
MIVDTLAQGQQISAPRKLPFGQGPREHGRKWAEKVGD